MAREKKCPQCAEMVKAEAAVCRFCGHAFPPETIAKPPMGKGKGCLIAIGVLVGLGVIGSIVGHGPRVGNSSDASAVDNISDPAAEAKTARDRTAYTAGQAIKAAVRNPDSLFIESGLASDDGKLLCVEYRAQNGFGGMNREFIAFQDGKPHQNDGFWNKHCRVMLNDVTVAVKYGAGL